MTNKITTADLLQIASKHTKEVLHPTRYVTDTVAAMKEVIALCTPPASAQPESQREGHPHEDPRFVALCREHDILGTAMQGLAAVFWREGGSPAPSAPGDAQDEQPKRNGCGSVSFKLSDGSAVSCDWSTHEWELSIPATRHERDIAFKELLQEIGRLRASVAAPAAGDALDEPVPEWASCESRGPWVTNSLKANAQELRDKEKRCRRAFNKDFMGVPSRYVADAYAEAAAVFEAKLAALAAQVPQQGEA